MRLTARAVSSFPTEESCPSMVCDVFCVNGFKVVDGCEICDCRESKPNTRVCSFLLLQLSLHAYIVVCEYTDVDEIAEKCGGKRCVFYNSTTMCAECIQNCGDTNGES